MELASLRRIPGHGPAHGLHRHAKEALAEVVQRSDALDTVGLEGERFNLLAMLDNELPAPLRRCWQFD